MPITWKNISAPDFSSGNSLMKAGAESMTGGLDSLAKAAKTYGTQQEDQRVAVRDDNTQTFLDQINQMKTMDGYTNQADQFNQSALSGQNVDASQIMSAYAGREQGIQDLDTSRFNYNEGLRKRTEDPLINQNNALVANKEYDKAAQFRADNPIADWSTYTNQANAAKITNTNQQRADEKYNNTKTLEEQKVKAGNLSTDILHAPGTTEGNIQATLQAAFDKEDIPQHLVEQYIANARKQYIEGTALTEVDKGQISSLTAQHDQNISNTKAHFSALLADNSTRITDDEYENYKKDSDSFSTQSQAIDYIGARSGESHILFWDTYTPKAWFTDDINGAQNAAEAIEITSEDYQRELEETGSEVQQDLLAQTGGQIPGFVLKNAFDRTGTDESGQWNVAVFHAALKKEWNNYVNQYGAIQIREKIDQDQQIALNALNKERLTGISKLTSELRNKQKGAFSNSN